MPFKIASRVAALLLLATVGGTGRESESGDLASPSWSRIDSAIQLAVDGFVAQNQVAFHRLAESSGLSSGCIASLLETVEGVKGRKKWAIQMLDATGKPPGGILDGTMMALGSFDECLKIRANASSGVAFRGRYCMLGFRSPLLTPPSERTPDGRTYEEAFGRPPEWISDIIEEMGYYLKDIGFGLGVCVPSTCTVSDVVGLAEVVARPIGGEVSYSDCQQEEIFVWPTPTIVAVCILSCLAVVCMLGTILDTVLRLRYRSTNEASVTQADWILRFFRAFSVSGNTEKLLQEQSGEDVLSFFNGIRVLSATWIILGHNYSFFNKFRLLMHRHSTGYPETFNGQISLAAALDSFRLAVSSFFFMSGFLLMYTNWRKLERSGGRINVFIFYIHKYWRMTPAVIVTILLKFLMPLAEAGPLLNPSRALGTCDYNWWRPLLYVYNWILDNECLAHTWYVSALMQMHIIAILLLICYFKWPNFGAAVISLILIGSISYVFVTSLMYDFPLPIVFNFRNSTSSMTMFCYVIYFNTIAHLPTYLIGMGACYLVMNFRNIKLKWVHQATIWLLAALSALLAVCGTYGPDEPPIVRASYISVFRIAWALALGWLSFACATGKGGLVNRMLSWKAFAPLGQLSYLVYLVHNLVIDYRKASIRERLYYGHTDMVYSFLGHTVVSFFIAYVFYVTVEMPFATLERMVFRRETSVKSDEAVVLKELKNICYESGKSVSYHLKPTLQNQ